MRLAAGAATDVGRVRDHNEDSYLIAEDHALFAVADGLGGHQAGEVASSTALEALRAVVASGRPIHEAAQSANRAVYDLASRDESMRGMGTTLTALMAIGGRTALIAHVGDSRAYRMRDGAIERLTEDHSLVEELLREGRLTAEQAEAHPRRAIITRALGLEPEVQVDLVTVPMRTGDRVVLCSDGLNTMVRDRDIERISRAEDDPGRAAERLVDAACEAGGEDNVTAVVVDVLEIDDGGTPDPEELSIEPAPRTPLAGPAPAVESEAPAPVLQVTRRRLRSALLLGVPLVLLLGLAFGTVAWYARRTYYVGIDGRSVAVFRGVPGGLWLWDPTVETRSDLRLSNLDTATRAALTDGAAEGSRNRAEHYLARLEHRAGAMTASTTTTTTARHRHGTVTTSGTRPATSATTRGAASIP